MERGNTTPAWNIGFFDQYNFSSNSNYSSWTGGGGDVKRVLKGSPFVALFFELHLWVNHIYDVVAFQNNPCCDTFLFV